MTPAIRLFFREPDIDTNHPIASGAIKVEGFETIVVDRLEDADVWDCPFGGRMLDFGKEPGCISVPAYPNRKFRLSYIYVNASAGIQTPKDLHGKRVAVRFWSNTAAIWARGALMHHFGMDLTKIRWISAAKDDSPIPAGALDIAYMTDGNGRAPGTVELDEMLAAGDFDAVIDANVPPSITRKDARTRRLFPDYASEEVRYYQATGIFPISHVVTLRAEFAARCPDAAMAVLRAFRQGRDAAFEAIEGSDPRVIILPWLSQYLREQRQLLGPSYFAYDVARNRTALDAMMQYAHEQWVTSRLIRAEELFDPGAAASLDHF